MGNIKIYSSIGLEPWKWDNPDLFGIGGSETSHIEMARRLGERGHIVSSYCPMEGPLVQQGNVSWMPFDVAAPETEPGLWIVYRDPTFFDQHLDPFGKYWFIAQDCDYSWTPERLEKVDRYWCLCKEHASFTARKYPQIKDKIYVTSNGVKAEKIKPLLGKFERNLNKCVYTSSPDRGLLFLLQNWFRVLERNPLAECHVFYGFENILKLLGGDQGQELGSLKAEIEKLMNQQGIVWRGRIPQPQLWEEYLTANAWYYPTDWPETSCISCMEAQACGAIPVTSNYWALKENVQWGWKTNGPPQHNNIDKVLTIDYLCDILGRDHPERSEMQKWALETFDWEKMVDQWEIFINADCI